MFKGSFLHFGSGIARSPCVFISLDTDNMKGQAAQIFKVAAPLFKPEIRLRAH